MHQNYCPYHIYRYNYAMKISKRKLSHKIKLDSKSKYFWNPNDLYNFFMITVLYVNVQYTSDIITLFLAYKSNSVQFLLSEFNACTINLKSPFSAKWKQQYFLFSWSRFNIYEGDSTITSPSVYKIFVLWRLMWNPMAKMPIRSI